MWKNAIALLFILTLGLVGVPGGSLAFELDGSAAEMAEQINSMRESRSLSRLEVDTILSDVMAKVLGKNLEELGAALFAESAWREPVERVVLDWDAESFAVTGTSEAEMLDELQQTREFVVALGRSDVSHVALAVGEQPDGGMWCVVCVTRRVVEFAPFQVRMLLEGPTFLTLSGTSPDQQMRARFYRSAEDPRTYEGEEELLDFEADESGRFEVTLPISRFGPGEYRIIVYIRASADADYEIAAQTWFEVQP